VLKTVWAEVRDAVAGVMDQVSFGDLVRRSASPPAERYVI
jgi:hypothetical protein